MNKKIRVALIGRGHWGQVYINTIPRIPNIILPDQYILGRDYKKYIKKIDKKNIDGVIIAATTAAHYQIVNYLLSYGFKNLLIEKPLTQNLKQALKLNEIINKMTDLQIMVGHTLLYDPAYIVMKQMAQHKIGKIMRINYTSLKAPPIKRGSVLQDAGPHPIYLFLDLVNKLPKKIHAIPTNNDNVRLTLEFDNGVVGVAEIGTQFPKRKRELVITGETAKLTLNEFVNPRNLFFVKKDFKKELFFPLDQTPLEGEVLGFYEFITHNRNPRATIKDGIEVVKIIEIAERSLKKGVPILYQN